MIVLGKVLNSWSITMKLPRRNFLYSAIGAAAVPALPRAALALDYPTRPVHFIVSFAAGGPTDTIARILGQYLSEYFGQQFVVENRVGAGGNIGMEVVLSSPPDGYTIGFVAPNNAINTTLYEHLPFDFLRDSTPGRWHDEARQRHGCEPVISGEEPCRVHRNGESRSGQDQFRFRRGGHFAAHVRRAFAGNGRHKAHARVLSRHGACDDGFARRSGTGAFRQPAGLDPADPGRPHPRARRDHGETRRHAA